MKGKAMDYILAHDLGTSGDKASIFTSEGKLVKSIIRTYSISYSEGCRVEQNPDDWYKAVCSATKEILQDIPASSVAAVGFSGHMMGAVPVDADGNLLHAAIIWADQRATEETAQLAKSIGDDNFYQITGNRNNPTNSIAKIMWLQKDSYIRSHMVKSLNCKDYIAFRLTGTFGTDYSDASGTGAFDINTFSWSKEIIQASGVNESIFPDLHPSTDLAGKITASAADETGLVEGTPVFRGCGDGTAASIGAGSSKIGDGYCCLGSSAWVSYMDKKPLLDKQKRIFNLAGISKDVVFPIGTMQAAGLSYNWMRDELCQSESLTAKESGSSLYDLIDQEIQKVPVGSNGLLFLPYLLGERAPWWNESVRGAFLGISKETKHRDMLRAVMEGITMNLSLILEALRQRNPFGEMRLIGGGAQNPVWRKILADAFNSRILKQDYLEEACSMGAAVVAGIGAGIFKDASDIEKFTKIDDVINPDPGNSEEYAKLLEKFKRSYLAISDL